MFLLLAQVTVRLSPDDATEHLRIVSIQDVTGRSLLFLASTNREAELLVCGLKLLLECESARLGVRGGMQLNKLGGEIGKGALSPSAARGSFKVRGSSRDKSGQAKTRHLSQQGYSSIGEHGSSSDSSDNNDERDELFARDNSAKINNRHQVPEGRSSWSQVPSRNRMREIADSATSPRNHTQIPPYVLGKEVSSHIVTDIYLPLPIPLCRVLFLDSSSPVNKAWENGRGDIDYQRTVWSFPPGAPREFEKNTPEQQLISGGSMVGAQRTVSYKRMRNRELVRLSETITVERDTNQTLSFAIVDRMPRRGFSVKTRVILRASGAQSCDASVIAELRPIGKNLSDQIAVHKAFILVLDEIKVRYGFEGKAGLLAIVIDTCNSQPPVSPRRTQSRNVNSFTDVLPANSGSKKASLTSFKDVLIGSKVGSATTSRSSSESKPVSIPSSNNSSTVISSQAISPRRLRNDNVQERPSTPSIRAIESKSLPVPSKNSNGSLQQNPVAHADDFADFSQFNVPKNPASAQLVEVKPLPKLRLDLCPVPREEDEEEESAGSFGGGKQKKKSKKHKHRRSSRNH